MSFRPTLSLAMILCALTPALAQAPPPASPVSPAQGMSSMTSPAVSMTPKDVEARKIETVKTQFEAMREALRLGGDQVKLWTGFENRALATIPSSIQSIRTFCNDPTPREGRGSFGATAKRIDFVIGLMRQRAAEMSGVEESLKAVRATFSPDQEKVFTTMSPVTISLVTNVPFGVQDTGTPFTCSVITGKQDVGAPSVQQLSPEMLKGMQHQPPKP